MKDKILLAGAALAALLLSGCWMGRGVPAGPPPPWAAQGSGVFEEGGARRFQGVGQFLAAAKPKILKQGADDKAQAAVAGVMNGYLDILTVDMDVAASTAPAAMPPLSDDAAVSLRRASLKVMRSRAQILERWQEPGAAWSLCDLDFADFKKGVVSSPDLAAGATSYFALSADAAFQKLLARESPAAAPAVSTATASVAAPAVSTAAASALPSAAPPKSR
ncbi:MAG TPA: hypothetical protein VNH15_06465 [Elusimicrobiota bacterium]|nr:hypothetical protein [Elusimicrobiota bacterium]